MDVLDETQREKDMRNEGHGFIFWRVHGCKYKIQNRCPEDKDVVCGGISVSMSMWGGRQHALEVE